MKKLLVGLIFLAALPLYAQPTPTPTRTPVPTRVPPEKYQGYLVFNDDFNQYLHPEKQCWQGPWELWLESPEKAAECYGGDSDNWPYIQRRDYPDTVKSNRAWRPGFLTTKVFCEQESGMFIIELSKQEGGADAEPEDWQEIMIEVDVHLLTTTTFGIMWEVDVRDDSVDPPVNKKPDAAYVLIIGPYDELDPLTPEFPDLISEFLPTRGGYYALYRIDNSIFPLSDRFNIEEWDEVVAPTRIVPELPSVNSLTYMRADRVYMFQLGWVREQLSLKYQLKYAPHVGYEPIFYGCASDEVATGICQEFNLKYCWCDVFNKFFPDNGYGEPGAVGLFISGAPGASCEPATDPQKQQSFDNFRVYSFRPPPPTPTSTHTATPIQ